MNKKAFTLVELIVVITILAILWTIAFISFQWYTRSSRDSVRINDLKLIEKNLSLYKVQTWEYPEPSDPDQVEYDLKEVWTQWTVWQSVITNLDKLNKVPRDPLTWSEYTYSRLNTKNELQLACILEWSPVALIKNEELKNLFSVIPAEVGIYKNKLISQANAADVKTTATAYVIWDYNWQIAKVNSWSTTYVLAVPSIINWDMTLTDVIEVISNKKLVYNWYGNLPSSYTWTIFEMNWWFDYSQTWWIVVYSWNINDLKSNEDSRLSLISNLKWVYSWTILENTWNIKQLVETDINTNTPSDDAKTLACGTVDFWLGINTIVDWCQTEVGASCNMLNVNINSDIATDTTWTTWTIYTITKTDFKVNTWTTLTIEPWVIVKLAEQWYMYLDWILRSLWTSENHINFISYRSEINSDCSIWTWWEKWDWRYVEVKSNSEFDYTDFMYWWSQDLWLVHFIGWDTLVTNSTFRLSSSHGMNIGASSRVRLWWSSDVSNNDGWWIILGWLLTTLPGWHTTASSNWLWDMTIQ